eukprot:CAMPEP_0119015364 /NCGR_PEP_ID=MMETSP1176-20130426/10897_1 /TAXON_ID=265551 /ORGANISM="Synedropsis recta cf, Strain CCMP1620" /LENGTH=165 /DNA_ID=CAMNT_0006968651 /DNA_START=102 /DNA_END=599 /DNA_ORIENTATION=-
MTKSLSLLLALLSVPGSFAYVASTTTHGSTKPTFMRTASIEKSTTTSQQPKYDLGLGKNPPVTAKKSRIGKEMSSDDAARFWMVPEAANNYPSPLIKNTKPDEPKRSPQQIIPSRMAEDAVEISGTNSDATAVFQVNPVDLEMNTLWVEMMIHQQIQQQYQAVPV